MNRRVQDFYLDVEKTQFFFFIWILPIILQLAIFIIGLVKSVFWWPLLLILLVWIAVFGSLYFWNSQKVDFDESGFNVYNQWRRRTYYYSDIAYIEEQKFLLNPLRKTVYIVHFFCGDAITINNPQITKLGIFNTFPKRVSEII